MTTHVSLSIICIYYISATALLASAVGVTSSIYHGGLQAKRLGGLEAWSLGGSSYLFIGTPPPTTANSVNSVN